MIRVNTDSRSSTNVTRNYKWNVKITQIDCTSKLEEIRNLKGNIIGTEVAFPFILLPMYKYHIFQLQKDVCNISQIARG